MLLWCFDGWECEARVVGRCWYSVSHLRECVHLYHFSHFRWKWFVRIIIGSQSLWFPTIHSHQKKASQYDTLIKFNASKWDSGFSVVWLPYYIISSTRIRLGLSGSNEANASPVWINGNPYGLSDFGNSIIVMHLQSLTNIQSQR